jgi:hypothetical protein
VGGTGAEGKKCSREQLKELSGLVRVRHMSAGEQQNGGYHSLSLAILANSFPGLLSMQMLSD